jgi:hypothetical protein
MVSLRAPAPPLIPQSLPRPVLASRCGTICSTKHHHLATIYLLGFRAAIEKPSKCHGWAGIASGPMTGWALRGPVLFSFSPTFHLALPLLLPFPSSGGRSPLLELQTSRKPPAPRGA